MITKCGQVLSLHRYKTWLSYAHTVKTCCFLFKDGWKSLFTVNHDAREIILHQIQLIQLWNSGIGHFQVAFRICLEASPRAKLTTKNEFDLMNLPVKHISRWMVSQEGLVLTWTLHATPKEPIFLTSHNSLQGKTESFLDLSVWQENILKYNWLQK